MRYLNRAILVEINQNMSGTKCSAFTKEGKRCTRNKLHGSEFCNQHDHASDVPDATEDDMHDNSKNETTLLLESVMSKLNELIVAIDISKQRKKGNLYTQAKKIYYHENKRESAILQIARDELNKSEGFGKAYAGKNIPWTLVKTVTDHAFESLDPQTKNEYVVRAMQ